MNTKLIHIDSEYDDAIRFSKEILLNEGVFVFPTDTVYGLGCLFDSEKAVSKIYELKTREFEKPLAAYFSSIEMMKKYILNSFEKLELLCETFLPGKLTIITEKNILIPDFVTSNFNTIGFRIPQNKFLLDLIESIGMPIVGTSANISNFPSAKTAKEASEIFINKIPLIIEDDSSISGLESTIVSLANKNFKILRTGEISEKQIMDILF